MATGSSLQTRRFLKRSNIHLLKDRINVIRSSTFDSFEFEISYESIDTKKTIETKINSGLIVILFFLATTGLLFFFGGENDISNVFFILAVIVFFIAISTKLKVITIKSHEGHLLELYFTHKNKNEVILFADEIISSANKYLLHKYTKIDKDLPLENQLGNLSFLRDKELLTDEHFEHLKNQLLGKENKQTIGYR